MFEEKQDKLWTTITIPVTQLEEICGLKIIEEEPHYKAIQRFVDYFKEKHQTTLNKK